MEPRSYHWPLSRLALELGPCLTRGLRDVGVITRHAPGLCQLGPTGFMAAVAKMRRVQSLIRPSLHQVLGEWVSHSMDLIMALHMPIISCSRGCLLGRAVPATRPMCPQSVLLPRSDYHGSHRLQLRRAVGCGSHLAAVAARSWHAHASSDARGMSGHAFAACSCVWR